MTECIHTLFSAWGNPSAEARETATKTAIGPDFCYSDPRTPAPITDVTEYLNYIQMFGEMAPGACAKAVNISERDGSARVTVDFIINENMTQRGQYFIDLKDGKIARIVGYAGMGEPS